MQKSSSVFVFSKLTFIFSLSTLLSICIITNATFEGNMLRSAEEITEEGRKKLTLMKSQLPRYGDCWKKALDKLESSCKQLTDISQSRMALLFTNCFLDNAGVEHYPCNENDDVKDCLKLLPDKGFVAYTEFFTHTQNICFFLQSQIWHDETSETINRLASSSAKVVRQLDASSAKQEKILLAQDLAIENQNNILSHGSKLNNYLENSQEVAQTLFEEFKSTTSEQTILINDVFHRISSLQNFVLDGFSGFYAVMFYVCSVVVAYLFTSSPRTSSARIWLFLIITVNLLLERYISTIFVEEENLKMKPLQSDGPIYSWIWFCRKTSCIISGIVLIYHAVNYKDMNTVNYMLLSDIRKQLDTMMNIGTISTLNMKSLPNNNHSMNAVKLSEEEESTSEDSDSDSSFLTVCDSCQRESISVSNYWHDKTIPKENKVIAPRYNLRSRSVTPVPNHTYKNETVESWTELVESIAKLDKRQMKLKRII